MGTVKFSGQVKINTTSNSTVKDYLVRFFDFDGTILKQQWVYSGETATAPIAPSHQYLTFNSWNVPFTGVTSDVDTGAIYDTVGEKTYLFISTTTASGLAHALYLHKSSTSLMTVDWGDGTSSTTITSGNQNIPHTYAVAGDYVLSVYDTNIYTLGGSSATFVFLDLKIITSVYIHSLGRIGPQCLYGANNVKNISLPYGLPNVGGQSIREIYALNHLNLPAGCSTNVGQYALAGLRGISYIIGDLLMSSTYVFPANYCLKKIKISPTQTIIYGSCFSQLFRLEQVVIPASVVTIQDAAFIQCYSLKDVILYATTPPTLGGVNSWTVNSLTKFYVPDASVDAYKTSWSTYANYIYPLSLRPKTTIL